MCLGASWFPAEPPARETEAKISRANAYTLDVQSLHIDLPPGNSTSSNGGELLHGVGDRGIRQPGRELRDNRAALTPHLHRRRARHAGVAPSVAAGSLGQIAGGPGHRPGRSSPAFPQDRPIARQRHLNTSSSPDTPLAQHSMMAWPGLSDGQFNLVPDPVPRPIQNEGLASARAGAKSYPASYGPSLAGIGPITGRQVAGTARCPIVGSRSVASPIVSLWRSAGAALSVPRRIEGDTQPVDPSGNGVDLADRQATSPFDHHQDVAQSCPAHGRRGARLCEDRGRARAVFPAK